jgi:hypothetical protein
MTTALLETSRPVRLRELVDAVAARSGCWVVVESFGQVMCHGTGSDAPPGALADTLVSKCTVSLRSAVMWDRGRRGLAGMLDGQPVGVSDLGEGGTAWFVGGLPEPSAAATLGAALHAEDSPVVDSIVHELLHPRGITRAGAAPPAQLVTLRSPDPVQALALAARRAVTGAGVRVHVEEDIVLVALPVHSRPEATLAAVRRRCPQVRAGIATTPEGAADWVTTFALAVRALEAARALNLELGDPADPPVAAELVVAQAEDAAVQLARQLPRGGIQRLEQHDRDHRSDLIPTLTAWCTSGFDVGHAAAHLHVHVNTLRYRLRRASALSGMDLAQPRQRLVLQLLLRHPARETRGSVCAEVSQSQW